MTARWIFVMAMLALSACGSVSDLVPAPGKSLPQKPALAARPLTADELLTPPPHARPVRVDELGKRGEPRQVDRFDLPPPDGTAAAGEAGAAAELGGPSSASTTGPDNAGESKRCSRSAMQFSRLRDSARGCSPRPRRCPRKC